MNYGDQILISKKKDPFSMRVEWGFHKYRKYFQISELINNRNNYFSELEKITSNNYMERK